MPLNDVFLTIRAVTAVVDRAAMPARAARARLVLVDRAFEHITAPIRAVQAAYKLGLPQFRNHMEMK